MMMMMMKNMKEKMLIMIKYFGLLAARFIRNLRKYFLFYFLFSLFLGYKSIKLVIEYERKDGG